ncbi:MAG TPA: vitamin K epoxide reductase family protein [Bryobacteraceae bacterium]|nr:vitamin K epoxide reductase family protein [Bryobacteraceae bacterium]
MRRSITLALSLLGLFDSLCLLYTYTSPSRPMVCIGTGCDAVRASAYSTLWGVSTLLFGVLGYSLLAIVIIAESLFSGLIARWLRYALAGMTGFGFVFSLCLEYLQAFVIHAYCAWCVTSGVVMTALFALALVNVARTEPEPEPATQIIGLRSLFAVCVTGLLAGVPAFYLLARHSELAPPAPQAASANLTERLVRPGVHEAGNLQAPLTVVEFGDFECPVCGRGEAAAGGIRTQYARQIRFIFRQFPLERIHPLAQRAAEASECAAEQGKFWEMVEKIYSRQYDLGIEGLERDAAELTLDRQRFNQCLASGAMAGRVRRGAVQPVHSPVRSAGD